MQIMHYLDILVLYHDVEIYFYQTWKPKRLKIQNFREFYNFLILVMYIWHN